MSFIGKPPNVSFITSRVHITMGFAMQQAHDFAWLVTQTPIGLAILMIVSLLLVIVFTLVQAPFVGKARSSMLLLCLRLRLSIKALLMQQLRPFGSSRFSQSLVSPLDDRQFYIATIKVLLQSRRTRSSTSGPNTPRFICSTLR